MRPGTICTGTTMRARTGAFTTCVDCASWISRSPIGSISQKVSVKSKGEFWMEQKFEYTRCVVWSSSGTIVKFTAFLLSSILGGLPLATAPVYVGCQYFRSTPITTPRTRMSSSSTKIGFMALLAGCRRMTPPLSR